MLREHRKGAFILKRLLEAGGGLVSGEELALELGVSRVALHKRIKRLVEMGIPIEAEERRGYRLSEEPDLLIPEVILAYMDEDCLFQRIECYPVVDSTNRLAKEMAEKGAPEGTVVVADSQTAGRGRLGRRWFSPAGRNLYFSVVLRPRLPAAFMYHATMLASVAVCEALREVGVDALIKWPNDVYASGRKICGVLTEAEVEGPHVAFLVVGIGVNVNIRSHEFPSLVAPIATSVLEETGSRCNRSRLLARILSLMDGLYKKLAAGETKDLFYRWREHNYTIGRRVKLEDGTEGEAIGITPVGELLVRDEQGSIITVAAGDVKVLQ